jgi:hypothetical protein
VSRGFVHFIGVSSRQENDGRISDAGPQNKIARKVESFNAVFREKMFLETRA